MVGAGGESDIFWQDFARENRCPNLKNFYRLNVCHALNIHISKFIMIVCFEVILHMYNNIILVLVVNRFDYILFLLELAGCCHNNFKFTSSHWRDVKNLRFLKLLHIICNAHKLHTIIWTLICRLMTFFQFVLMCGRRWWGRGGLQSVTMRVFKLKHYPSPPVTITTLV